MASSPLKANGSSARGSTQVTLVIGRSFSHPGVPKGAGEALARLRELRPELVHEEMGQVWLGHRHPGRFEATNGEIAAAVSAIAAGVPAELLWHPELRPLAVCRVETDR